MIFDEYPDGTKLRAFRKFIGLLRDTGFGVHDRHIITGKRMLRIFVRGLVPL